MEGTFMSTAESQYYPQLFSKSDTESSGRVSVQRAMNLFRRSPQLTDDIIQKINEVCGAQRLGYYGRSQFYCALKMIAMVQNGLPLPSSVDFVMQAGLEVPLPEFVDEAPTQTQQGETDSNRMEFENPAFSITDIEFTLNEGKGNSAQSRLPPLKPSRPPNSNSYTPQQTAQQTNNVTQPPSSPPVSPSQSPPILPAQSATPAGPRTRGSMERNQSLPASIVLDDEGATTASQSPMATPRLEKQASAPQPTKPDEGWASFDKTVDADEEEEGQDTSWARFPPSASPSSSRSSTPASSHHTSESPIDNQSGGAPDTQDADVDTEEEEEEEDAEEEEEEEDDGEGDKDDKDEEEKEVAKEEEVVVAAAVAKEARSQGDGEEGDEEDVWRINSEQREYYTKQFKMLQPDPTGLLPGSEAKVFFEKSKLATEELSKIWQLSDVNKDGTLSLEEFCTAMHLVVLRKHNIPLPDELPNCLIPKIPAYNGEEDVKPGKKTTPVPIPGATTTTTIHPIQPHVHTGRSVTPPSSGSEMKNADDDAKIFQPIALHIAPDGKPVVQPDADATETRPRTFSDPGQPDQDENGANAVVAPMPVKPRAMTLSTSNAEHTPTKIAPPPEWDKTGSVTSPRPVIPPRPTPQQMQQSKTLSMDITSEHDFADFSKFEALKTKSSSLKIDRRGVSLDFNNRLSEQTFPPVLPPRPSGSASEEDLVGDKDEKVIADVDERMTPTEAEIAERRREQFSKDRTRHVSAPVPLGVAELRSGDRKSIQARIRTEKEENTKLSRHNGEMQQELRTLTDQRLALEIQLEHLRPFSNTAS